jgi:hypothetical protein
MSAGRGPRRLALVVLAAAVFATTAAPALQDDGAAEQAKREIGTRIEELGTTLRAAVMSGALEADVAKEIYGRVARAAKASYLRDFGDGGGKADDAAPSPKGNVIRLTAPKPEQVRMLLQAEFLRRDLPLLRDALGLDRDQTTIVAVLFEDYAEAYALASAPLREALAQHRSATMNAYIAFALKDADVKLGAALESARKIDRERAIARMTETLARIDREKAEGLAAASDEDRARYEAWKRSMIAATGDLDARLAAIRDRATAQLATMGRADGAVTVDDLVRLAKQLRLDRAHLRADLTESVRVIATQEQRGAEDATFDAAMARVRLGHLLPRGRLGGESMNLLAALAEATRRSGPLELAEAMLAERASEIAARLDERTEATIDRELAGLELRSARARIAAARDEPVFEVQGRRLAGVAGPYVAALHREISASVAARDALLGLLDESSAFVEATYPDTGVAGLYREAALRRGFPVETRRRWSERAIAAALELDGLDDDATEALLALDTDVAIVLRSLRANAIAERVRRDPKLARDLVDVEFGRKAKADIDERMWREVEHAAFDAVDDRAEGRLRGVLLPEQLDRLPPRRRKR